MYQLYISEEKLELKVAPLKAGFKNDRRIVEFLQNTPYEIYYQNELYRLCGKRAPLVELARDIKNGWLVQAKNRVQKIEEIKI
jgi:hypothetical protein